MSNEGSEREAATRRSRAHLPTHATRTPFIGRTDLLDAVAHLAGSVGRLGPAAAFLAGEPGSGKTRTIEEAATRIRLPRFAIAGYEFEDQVALAACSSLLRALAAGSDRGPDTILTAPRPDRPLDPLFLFEAVHEALRRHGPAVITVDDAQWLDHLSLALVHFLARGAVAGRLPLVLLVAGRPAPDVDAIGDTLAGVYGERFLRVQLDPLDRDDGVRLARAIAPGLDDERAEQVWKRARGFPFWIEALARSDDEEGDARRVIGERLRRLTPDAVAVVTVLTAAARPIPEDELGAILGWTAERLDEALRRGVNHAVVVRAGGAVTIAHDLIREAAAVQVPAANRRAAHERIADHLEANAGHDLSELLSALGHRQAAGRRLTDLALRILRSPQRNLLGSDDLRRLADVADRIPEPNEALPLHAEIAYIAATLGNPVLARERWTIVSRRHERAEGRAHAALAAAAACFELKRYDEGLDLVTRARALAGSDAALRVRADAVEAMLVRWGAGRIADAKELSFRAIDAARTLIARHREPSDTTELERVAYVAALRARLDVAVIEQDVDGMMALVDEFSAASLDPAEDLRAGLETGLALLIRARLDLAEERLREVKARADRQVFPPVSVESGFWLAQTLFLRGQLSEATAVATAVAEQAERVAIAPARISISWIRTLPFVVALSSGDRRSAFTALEREAERETHAHYRLRLRHQVACAAARLGLDDAPYRVDREADAGSAAAEAVACDRCKSEFTLRIAEALARTGRHERAAALLREWETAHPRVSPLTAFWKHRAEATGAAVAGLDRAERILDELIELADRQGMRLEGLWARIDLAALVAQSDRERAAVLVRNVHAEARRMGAATEEAITRRMMQGLGIRAWRRSAAEAGALSRREIEVARLVAAGASNPEIAQALFLSRRTVERHVSNIFTKLGVRNRTELARALDPSATS